MGKPNAPLLGEKARFGDIGLISEGCDGLTIRQYFMAHAPAEPQKWFHPMIGPRPEMPDRYKELTPTQRKLWEQLEGNPADDTTPDGYTVNGFQHKWEQALEVAEAYDAEYVRQRYAQWPAAWADAVLAAGEK